MRPASMPAPDASTRRGPSRRPSWPRHRSTSGLHLAANRSPDDPDEADLHEHGRHGSHARSLARLAGRHRCPDGRPLSASTVTIPAGAEASIHVLLDPSLPGTGSFSGVVIASGPPPGRSPAPPSASASRASTTTGRSNAKPRSGTQDGTHVIGLAGLDVSFFDQRVVTGSRRPVDHLARPTRDVQRRRDQLRPRRRRRRGGRAHLRSGGRRPLGEDDHARR